MKKKNIAIYPGTFDPMTNGHYDIIKRASFIFDELIVAVVDTNLSKNILFTTEERVLIAKELTKEFKNVKIMSFKGLLVDFVKENSCNVIIRGLRALTDFEYEFQMALINKKLDKKVETLFMVTSDNFTYLSSSLVKELARLNGKLDGLVDDFVNKKLKEKFC